MRVLCLWRMAERGNRGAASELERAARELGRSRVEIKAGEARVRERRSRDARAAQPRVKFNSTPPHAARSNSLVAPRFPLSAIRHKQSTRTRSPTGRPGRQSRQLRRLQPLKNTISRSRSQLKFPLPANIFSSHPEYRHKN